MSGQETTLGHRMIKLGLALGLLMVATRGEMARGDGGTVRLSRSEGKYQVTVFTAPTPFRAGVVDISVLVQDATTRAPVSDARVTVELRPRDRSTGSFRHVATADAATNKLFQAAVFELPAPGLWDAEVIVEGKQGESRLPFELTAAARAPQLPAIWLWIAWPVPVILLFGIHQLLVGRKVPTTLS